HPIDRRPLAVHPDGRRGRRNPGPPPRGCPGAFSQRARLPDPCRSRQQGIAPRPQSPTTTATPWRRRGPWVEPSSAQIRLSIALRACGILSPPQDQIKGPGVRVGRHTRKLEWQLASLSEMIILKNASLVGGWAYLDAARRRRLRDAPAAANWRS